MTLAATPYMCMPCGYIYDPADPQCVGEDGHATAFEDLHEDWRCPVCGVGKEEFDPV